MTDILLGIGPFLMHKIKYINVGIFLTFLCRLVGPCGIADWRHLGSIQIVKQIISSPHSISGPEIWALRARPFGKYKGEKEQRGPPDCGLQIP
jgi:hypothetical protein